MAGKRVSSEENAIRLASNQRDKNPIPQLGWQSHPGLLPGNAQA